MSEFGYEAVRKDRGLSGKLFSAMTGRDSGVGGGVADKLRAAFGPGPRGGAVNTRAAAKALGVSQRQVQRWASGQAKPRSVNVDRINKVHRRAMNTKAGRRQAAAGQRQAFAKNGVRLFVSGVQGPVNQGGEYIRARKTYVDLTPEQARQMLDAYENGGAKATMDWMRTAWDKGYAAEWEFQSIDRMWHGPRGG